MLARQATLLLALIPFACLCPARGQQLTVDEIITRHLEARGGIERLRDVRTLVYRDGLYEEGDYRGVGDAMMAFMRPYFRVVGNPAEPGGYMEGYDGAAWEWFADPGIVVRTVGAAAGAMRRGAALDGPFVDYRARGSTVVLGEPDEIGGRPAHRLVVTLRDGFVREYFVDAESYLVTAERRSAPVHAFGEPVTSETRIGDYREVAGVLFAHSYVETEIATGEVMSRMQWGRIEANLDLPAAWFSPPGFERTPLQRFLENLFGERTDAKAVMWTYHEFRRTRPEIDTRAGVEVIGYQMLKMGDVDSAIALLEANAADHPGSSNSAFGLGRAYHTAGREADARRQFERALELDADNSRARRALHALGPERPAEAARKVLLYDPAWSPVRNRVAFYSDRSGNFDLYLLDLDAGTVTRLTDYPGQDGNPAWSADGSSLSFTSDRDGASDLYVLDVATGDVRRLTANDFDEGAHDWSPSGEWVAIERRVGDDRDLYLVAPDGTGERHLTRHPGNDFRPSWCPGGERIVFQSKRGDHYRLYATDPRGEEVVQLTAGAGHQAAPDCGPVSGRIVYVHHDDSGKSSIWVAAPDGSSARALTGGSAGSDMKPSWSPDESRIVFTSDRDGYLALYIMRADGSDQQRIDLP